MSPRCLARCRPGRLALPVCIAACAALVVLAPPAAPAQEPTGTRYYLSNQLGMTLEEIGWYRRDEAEFVLAVWEQAGGEVRTLLERGREVKRWELEKLEERVYENGQLAERTRLDSQGRRVELWEYEAGTLAQRTEYSYSRAGQISARAYDAEGRLLFTDRALLSRDHALREVRREPAQGEPSRLALSMAGDGLVEERTVGAGGTLIRRFDARGRVLEQERWVGERLAERETFFYGGGDTLARSTLLDYASGSSTERNYDEKGNLERLAALRDGEVVEQTRYERDAEGRATLVVRRGPAGLEKWRYGYDEKGDLLREEYRLRGSLERVTHYDEGVRSLEELYREGALFMRVVYRDGQRIREEFVKDGVVLRTREVR